MNLLRSNFNHIEKTITWWTKKGGSCVKWNCVLYWRTQRIIYIETVPRITADASLRRIVMVFVYFYHDFINSCLFQSNLVIGFVLASMQQIVFKIGTRNCVRNSCDSRFDIFIVQTKAYLWYNEINKFWIDNFVTSNYFFQMSI